MAITKLTVENFKSFNKLEVELRPFNIVVGSNASGKSNFLDVFKFLRDIEATSLENAIGIRGGGEILRNFNRDENQVLRIRVETDDSHEYLVCVQDDRAFGTHIDRTTYEISILFDESDSGFEVVTEKLAEYFNIVELHPIRGLDSSEAQLWIPRVPSLIGPNLYKKGQNLGSGKTVCVRNRDQENHSTYCRVELLEEVPFGGECISPIHGTSVALGRPQKAMLERSSFQHRFLPGAAPSLASISAYDFDPSKAQLAVPPSGSRQLDEDAENLSVVLRDIIKHPESKRRLINLVSVLLPFVHDLDVEEFGFGQLMTTLAERFSDKGHRLPAFFASDGTVACLALVVALYFQDDAVAVFEEPDRHVHPHLASRVMQMMNEVTDDTQVIVTTHNAELLRHANLDDILLVTRDSDGNSQITRPADSEVINLFLQNELGVEDLFAQDLLAL